MFKLSIITTFYNASEYIYRTLTNLRKMENDEIQFVLVNDGSLDNTLEILNTFRLKNKIVLDQSNTGVSGARNYGLTNAKGEYVLFLDGDDWLDENLYMDTRRYLDSINDVIKFGLVFTDLSQYKSYEIINKDRIIESADKNNIICELLKTSKLNSASNQIIKRETIIKNNIRFKEKIKFAEDFDFNFNLFSSAQRIILLKTCLYYYYQNNNSTTNLYSYDNVTKCLYDAVLVYVEILKNIKNHVTETDYEDVLTRVYNEIKSCFVKVFYIDRISVRVILDVLENQLVMNERYQFLKREIDRYKIIKMSPIDKGLLLIKKLDIIICFCWIKLKRKLKKRFGVVNRL